MANETGKTLPLTGLMDIIRLICGLLRALMPNRYFLNPGLVLSDWIRDLTRRRPTDGIILNFGFRRFSLVTGRDLSRHILDQSPSTKTYAAGPGKVAAVSFLAEKSLTLSHYEKWDKLRPLNEQTLSTRDSPDFQQAALSKSRWHLPNLYPALMTFETVWARSCWDLYLALIRHNWLKTYKSCLAMSNPCREEYCWDGPKEAAGSGFMGRFGSLGMKRMERVCLPGRIPFLKGGISRKSSCCNRSPIGCSRLPGRAPICCRGHWPCWGQGRRLPRRCDRRLTLLVPWTKRFP